MSTKTPRLSIGLPVYNGEPYLTLTLDSILSQTYGDFELIVSDNASTDRTAEICAAYAARDERIRYSRFPSNQGAAFNYNHVAEQAQGEYFKWAAHDDLIAPTFFERCVVELDANSAVVLAYPKTLIIGADGEPIREYNDDLHLNEPEPAQRFECYLQIYRRPHSCNPVFGITRLRSLMQTGLIGSYISSDMVLLGELALHGQIHEIQSRLFFRRDHPRASVRAYPAYRDRIAWFDPRAKGRLQLTKWRWLKEYIAAIQRAPLSTAERNRCYRLIARWTGWNMGGLSKDLLKAGLWPLLKAEAAGK